MNKTYTISVSVSSLWSSALILLTISSMKYLLVILMVLSLIGCGRKIKGSVDGEFNVYIADFIKDFGTDPTWVSMEFKDNLTQYGQYVVGVCTWDNGPKIYISKSFWEYSSNYVRKALIYHEIGHCVLGKGHDDEQFTNGCYKSIMSSWVDSDTCYEQHMEEKIERMKQ